MVCLCRYREGLEVESQPIPNLGSKGGMGDQH
jgi:hypothetical protein